jgi:chaperonin cofactor prefoldin
LGPRSTAALAELQSQLLTMAVEKATLQRQLQQGRSEVEKLQEKVRSAKMCAQTDT